MTNQIKIGKIKMCFIFILLLLPYSASADNSKMNDSDYKEISDSFIKEFTNDSLFIAYRGTLPETIDQKWENSIVNCWLNLTKMGSSYSEFDRSIKSIAANKVIIIELKSAYKEEINDSRIDEIYQKVDDYCEQQEGMSEIPVVFIWAQDEEDLPSPDYGPESFERAKNETGFITTRGKMPEIHHEEEKWKWIDLLINGSKPLSRPNSNAGIKPYSAELGGPLISFGTNINGYLRVGFEEYFPEKVNESVIDEIYQVIDKHFEQEGISEVPVVFFFEHITLTEGAPADGPNTNKSDDANILDNKEKTAGNETINRIPGFTYITFVLGLLSLLITRRS